MEKEKSNKKILKNLYAMRKHLFYKRRNRLLRGLRGYQRLLQGYERLPAGTTGKNDRQFKFLFLSDCPA